MLLTSLVQHEPGDRFSTLVLGMYNFFRTIDTDAQGNKRYVLDRVGNAELMIGVVADPECSETDPRLDCLWAVTEALDAVVFNGDAMLNLEGNRILSRNGEHDVLM
jgi:hypothetical protein